MFGRAYDNILLWSIVGLTLTFGFNNCAEQRFSTDRSSIVALLNQGGGILINRGDEFTQSKAVWLDIAADGASEMYITNDPSCSSGGDWESLKPLVPWNLEKENNSTSVYVKFKTHSGVESDCISDGIVHDNVGPSVSFARAPESISSSRQAQFSILAKDSLSGISEIECAGIDSLDFQPCTSLVSKAIPQENSYVFSVGAKDRAGNISETAKHSWLVDWTPPVVTLNETPPVVTGSDKAKFTLSATDNLAGVKDIVCFQPVTNQEVSCLNGAFEISSLTDGNYTTRMKAIDRAGNSSGWKEYKWRVDLTAPSITLVSTPNPYDSRLSAKFEFEGKDGNDPVTAFQCRIDSGSFQACSSGFNFPVSAGSRKFEVVAVDGVGNTSVPAAYSWLVDNQVPTVTWVSTPGQYSNDQNPKLVLNASDTGGSGIDKVFCTLNGTPIDCSNNTIAPSNLSENRYQVSVIAKDKAGNSSSPLAHLWNVDRTAPTIRFTKTPASLTQLTSDGFEFLGQDSVSPIVSYQCRLDGSAFANCVSPSQLSNLAQGLHGFEVRAVDAAGNLSSSISYSWTVDSVGPDIVILERPVDHAYGIEDKIGYQITDAYSQVVSVQCGLAGALTACSIQNLVNLGIMNCGNHTYVVTAKDQLGNSTTVEVKWSVQVTLDPQTQLFSINGSNAALDVLFVVDNSGSMIEEQAEIKNRISGFISKLQGIDWQIAVTSTDPGPYAPFGDGTFRAFSNGKNILTPQDANPEGLLGSNIYMGSSGSGDERGINANYRVIQKAKASSTSPQAKLIRSSAALATVLISDEDECSSGCSANVVSSSPQGLINLVKTELAPDKRFAFHSIIWRPGTVCSTGAVEGNTYKQLTDLTGGILGDVCASSYANQLNEIGTAVRNLVKSVQLKCAPFDGDFDGQVDLAMYYIAPNQTKVLMTMATHPYTLNDKLVTFTNQLPEGSYEFIYNCLK
ncbi:MAG: VWA domain-containing protein [Bdellovibrionales bacterium]|nr:VWA domain-containing protein [Bdellovibrionales bacterium]